MTIFAIASRVALAAAGLLVLLAVVFAISRASFVSGAERTSGTVVGLRKRVSDRYDSSRRRRARSTSFAPVVTFRDSSGRSHRFVSATGSNPPTHGVGDAIDVLYEPDDPATASVADFWSLWLVPVVLGIFGVVMLGAAGVFRLLRTAQPRRTGAPPPRGPAARGAPPPRRDRPEGRRGRVPTRGGSRSTSTIRSQAAREPSAASRSGSSRRSPRPTR